MTCILCKVTLPNWLGLRLRLTLANVKLAYILAGGCNSVVTESTFGWLNTGYKGEIYTV